MNTEDKQRVVKSINRVENVIYLLKRSPVAAEDKLKTAPRCIDGVCVFDWKPTKRPAA